MPTNSPVPKLLEDLAATLRDLDLRWYLFGAQAAAIYGSRRVTSDVDVTVDPAAVGLAVLLERLKTAGFAPRVRDPLEFAEGTGVLPLLHIDADMDLDLVLAGSGLEADFLRRARPIDIGGTPVPLITAEDLIITKLLAGRPHDLDDAQQVLAQQAANMDLQRVRDILVELEEALAVGELLPTFERLWAASRS